MNILNDIGDEEFVPFLHSLGVETYNLSFEWMLNDPEFAGVLRWLFNNLDQNNTLSAREEYRYIEIEKKGKLLPTEDLESSIASIQDKHPNICLPGDQEAKEDAKLQINMLKEKVSVLEKQECIVKDMIRQNDLIKEELQLELSQLSSAQQQCSEDEVSAAEQCTTLANELEVLTDGVVHVIAENLQAYASCKSDKEKAKRYLAFSPLESYRHTQSLFRSHFDLYVSKHLTKRENDITNEDFRSALVEAKDMEERLAQAAFAFIESKAELSGEQAKLALVTNYNNVHPSQITSSLVEARTALELLEQEENIVEQQVKSCVEEFVKHRTEMAVNTATAAALNVRLHIQNTVNHLVTVWQQALALDKLLYFSLRQELRTLEEFVQFASQLRQYVVTEEAAVASRIESMNEICAQHAACEIDLESSNPLLQVLLTMLGKPHTNDATVLVKMYHEMEAEVKEIADNVEEGFGKKEIALMEFNKSTKPLQESVWNGCTKQANSWDRTVTSLFYHLKDLMKVTDKKVLEASEMFTSVKSGDKRNLRKLWQWFLTDPSRFIDNMRKLGQL